MSEAKGPYKLEVRVEDERVVTVFPNGRRLEWIGGFGLNDVLNEAYENGRASRGGLREALISISRNTCCEQCQQAKLVALAALEADGEGGIK